MEAQNVGLRRRKKTCGYKRCDKKIETNRQVKHLKEIDTGRERRKQIRKRTRKKWRR